MIHAALRQLHHLLDSTLGALLGGVAYGGWAVFANQDAGGGAALGIGLAHFAMSVALTMIGVRLMSALFRLPADPRRGALFAFCGSMLLTYALLIGVHSVIGTPHILLTLAPGLLPTLGFCAVYSLLLLRRARFETFPSAHAFASDLH